MLPRLALLRALGHRPFTLVWGGALISRIGDFLYELALAWWVLQETGSPKAMATVLILVTAPMVAFLLVGGIVVDRFARVRVMLASDLARGIVVTIVAGLAFADALELWHVYIAAFLFGTVDAFFQPAYTAAMPELVPREDLPSANSLSSLAIQAGRIVGPPLGGVLVAAGGTALAFGANGLSFFLSAALLLPLLAGAARPVRATGSSVFAEAREGVGTVLASPWLFLTIGMAALVNMTLLGPYAVSIPFRVRDELGRGPETLGLLYAAFPAGYVAGGLVMGRLRRIPRRGPLAYSANVVAGLGLLTVGLPLPIPVLMLAAFVNGIALEVFTVVWVTSLQQLVPSHLLGRVSSIDLVGSYALIPVGFALAGWATDAVGPSTTLIAGGGTTAIAAALALLHPAIRNLD